ncbi:MAG: alpha/beta fold hydrolase [Pseudomonadota bacterium]|nr:alpha/beta fold hydrolase [Pseudomonadota bacterium]
MAKRRRSVRRNRALRSAKNADWAFHAADAEVLDALADGRRGASLREYFGAPAYAELSDLAAAAKRAKKSRIKKSRGTRVLILPGIMGSKLGRAAEVLWIDPLQIAAGRLTALSLPSEVAFKPMGVLLFSYARLKLTLQIAGFDVAFHAYDWRTGLDQLGAQLAAKIAADRRPVILVAHSMGALVARMAVRGLPRRLVRRLVMLGAPNLGSFASVQALRGTYPFVRRMSTLDRKHSPEYLTEKVFRTFPGLYHMLPAPQRVGGMNLFDPASWPNDGPTPDPTLLAAAATVRAELAPVDPRMIHVVGVNQETIVGLRRTAGGFEYAMNRNGDGTVPLALAKLPKLKTYFVDESHADLANNSRVIQAIVDLIRRGSTRELPERWRSRPGVTRYIDDVGLRMDAGPKIDWGRLTPPQRETVFAALDSGRLLPAAAHPLA